MPRLITIPLISALLVGPLVFTRPAHAATVPYFARFAGQEAMLSEMALHPATVRVGSITYLAFQGVGFDPHVVSYDSSDETWRGPTRVGSNPLRLDAHGAPSLYVDPAGRVHAFYGGHGTTLLHARQTEAGPDASWQAAAPLPAGTYPQAIPMGGANLLVFYRAANGVWSTVASADGGTTFGSPQPILAADAAIYWYADFRLGPDGIVRATFTWVDQALKSAGYEFVRRHVYYAERGLDGTWVAADGSPLSLPVTRAAADAHCRIVDSGSAFVNEVTVKVDAAGAPCVLYLIGSGSGPGAYSWRVIRRQDGQWRTGTIVTTDHFFDAAALDPRPDGSLEAFVVTGDSDATGTRDGDYRGRGGRVERWVSEDHGLTWRFVERVSPPEPGVIYSDPVLLPEGDPRTRLVFTDWSDDESRFFHRLFLWGDDGFVMRETDLRVERLAGPDRAATAIEMSKRAFPEGARAVVIATQADFPDALAGTPLAAAVNGPVLLTPPDRLREDVAAEIRRLGVRQAIILGGTNAVSAAVDDALRNAGITSVERVGGGDRYATALQIARRMRDPDRTVTTAIVVSGRNWPDAVVAAPLAAANGWPIVLAEGEHLPAASATALAEYGTSRTIIVGGTSAVESAVESDVPAPYRIGGTDRYETAAALATFGLGEGLLPGRVIFATGHAFPDAVGAGALGSRSRAPILLVRRDAVPPDVAAYLRAHSISLTDLWFAGESDVMPEAIATELTQLVLTP
ncbi:MAG: cell wall-binding repeat-containing protein [Coriobacteriia bacterium]